VAARTHSYTPTPTSRGESSGRATLATVCGLVAALAIPVGIELTRKVSGAQLLDAAWAIPVAAIATVASLVLARGGTVSRVFRGARVLAITGICLTLSSALAVGIYEFLLRLEHVKHAVH
jgi:uncharacterized membrane protein